MYGADHRSSPQHHHRQRQNPGQTRNSDSLRPETGPDLQLLTRVSVQVLDAGRIHAYAEPYVLLQDDNNIFYKMIQQTGKQEAAALLEAAKQVRFSFRTTFVKMLVSN